MARIGNSFISPDKGFQECNISQLQVDQTEKGWSLDIEMNFKNGAKLKKKIFLTIEFDDQKNAVVNASIVRLHKFLDAINLPQDGINSKGLFETSNAQIIDMENLQQYLSNAITTYWTEVGIDYPFVSYVYDEQGFKDKSKVYTQAYDLSKVSNLERYREQVKTDIAKGFIKVFSATQQPQAETIVRPTIGQPSTQRM